MSGQEAHLSDKSLEEESGGKLEEKEGPEIGFMFCADIIDMLISALDGSLDDEAHATVIKELQYIFDDSNLDSAGIRETLSCILNERIKLNLSMYTGKSLSIALQALSENRKLKVLRVDGRVMTEGDVAIVKNILKENKMLKLSFIGKIPPLLKLNKGLPASRKPSTHKILSGLSSPAGMASPLGLVDSKKLVTSDASKVESLEKPLSASTFSLPIVPASVAVGITSPDPALGASHAAADDSVLVTGLTSGLGVM